MAALSEVRVPAEIVVPVVAEGEHRDEDGNVVVNLRADVANARIEVGGETIGAWSNSRS